MPVIQGWKYGNYLSLIQTVKNCSEYKKGSTIFFPSFTILKIKGMLISIKIHKIGFQKAEKSEIKGDEIENLVFSSKLLLCSLTQIKKQAL